MTREDIFKQLQAHAEPWRRRFDVASLAVFGSYCRDEQTTESDLDILVRFQHDPTFDNFMGLKYAIEDMLGMKVDLVTESALRPQWREKILRECQRVA